MEQRLVRKILGIDGMTCTGCETRIENALKKIHGVVDVKAIYGSSNVYVTYNAQSISYDQIIDAVEKLDYTVVNKPATDTEHNTEGEASGIIPLQKKNYGQFIGMCFIRLALYLIIKNTVGFNFIPEINQSMGYGILFVVGLITSLHCIAMCGGINLSLCMQYTVPADRSRLAKLKPSALYNIGRVLSYTVVGGIVGAIGSAVHFSGAAKGIVAILSGLFMLIMGLNMLNIFPWLRKLNPRMPKIFGRKVNSSVKKKGPLLVGILNGLMPCGPLQAMQLYALGTGSFASGALAMFLFSVGTVPLMFGFGALSSFLSGKFTHKMMKVSAMLVIVLGVVMLNRGLSLSGYNVAFAANTSIGSSSIAVVEDGVQYVTTDLESGRYTPIIVQKGIPVKWTIKADKPDLNGCNNPVTVPKLGIEKKLVPGDNIIQFTPEEEGNIVYTCWMGMISSRINVVGDIANLSEEEINSSAGSGFTVIEGPEIKIPTDEIAVGKVDEGKQVVSITMNLDAFSPAVVVIQEGLETRWVIHGESIDSVNNRLVFPEYNATIELDEGENEINFIPEGDFTFMNWSETLYGYVKVVKDINNINLEDIRNEVEEFRPSPRNGSNSGASCH